MKFTVDYDNRSLISADPLYGNQLETNIDLLEFTMPADLVGFSISILYATAKGGFIGSEVLTGSYVSGDLHAHLTAGITQYEKVKFCLVATLASPVMTWRSAMVELEFGETIVSSGEEAILGGLDASYIPASDPGSYYTAETVGGQLQEIGAVLDGMGDIEGLGIYNVKSYGAKGDNLTDDTAAIKLAIAALPTGTNEDGTTRYDEGGILYFPPGTYLITDTLTLAKNGITVLGAGVNQTTLNFSTMTGAKDCLSAGSIITDSNIDLYKLVFKDFQIVGGAGVNDGIHLENIHRYEITRVDVFYCNNDGVHLEEAYSGEINNCHVAGNQGIGINAAATASGRNYACHAIRVTGGEVQGNNAGGIYIYGSSAPFVSCIIEANSVFGIKTSEAMSPTISGCYFESNVKDIWLTSGGDNGIGGVIAGNYNGNSSTTGILIDNHQEVEIHGNFMNNITLGSASIRCNVGVNHVTTVTDNGTGNIHITSDDDWINMNQGVYMPHGFAVQNSLGNYPTENLFDGQVCILNDRLWIYHSATETWDALLSSDFMAFKTCTTATRPTTGNVNGRSLLDLTINKVITYVDGSWYSDGVSV